MPRWLAVDLGAKRVGLALCDPDEMFASPAGMIPAEAEPVATARRVARFAAEHQTTHAVVGLPLNMDGSVGPQAKLHQEFATLLTAAGLAQVELFDERLTSFQAEDWLRQSGLTHAQKKRVRDSLAALAILQAFLAARRTSASDSDKPPGLSEEHRTPPA